MKRITCREIGEKLGLSHVTVSLALRDHPSLPAKTKEKVRKLAAELGYRPDPALSALNAYRQASRGYKYQATLAWINTYPRSEPQHIPQYVAEATRRAEELGFQLERFWAPEYADWTRLVRTLKSRRIEGILLPSPVWVLNPAWNTDEPDSLPWRNFPWGDFSVISIGQAFVPAFHLVINNQFQSATLAVRKLYALGYRKIGIVLPAEFSKRTEFHFFGGYLAECKHFKLQPLYLLDETPGNSTPGNLRFKEHTIQWTLRHRPDAVIVPGAAHILPALHDAKLRVPEDIAVAILAFSNEFPEVAGIDQRFRKIGEVAANQLVDLIRRNERGIPDSPLRHLVEGIWIDGPSAPAKTEQLCAGKRW